MNNEQCKSRRYRGIIGPLVLIIIGVVFLLEKNGYLDREMIAQWWPLLLIFIGVGLLAARLRNHER